MVISPAYLSKKSLNFMSRFFTLMQVFLVSMQQLYRLIFKSFSLIQCKRVLLRGVKQFRYQSCSLGFICRMSLSTLASINCLRYFLVAWLEYFQIQAYFWHMRSDTLIRSFHLMNSTSRVLASSFCSPQTETSSRDSPSSKTLTVGDLMMESMVVYSLTPSSRVMATYLILQYLQMKRQKQSSWSISLLPSHSFTLVSCVRMDLLWSRFMRQISMLHSYLKQWIIELTALLLTASTTHRQVLGDISGNLWVMQWQFMPCFTKASAMKTYSILFRLSYWGDILFTHLVLREGSTSMSSGRAVGKVLSYILVDPSFRWVRIAMNLSTSSCFRSLSRLYSLSREFEAGPLVICSPSLIIPSLVVHLPRKQYFSNHP